MSLPIVASYVLIIKERIKTMRGPRERPFDTKVRSETYDENTLPFLWDAIVSGVYKRGNHVVSKSFHILLA